MKKEFPKELNDFRLKLGYLGSQDSLEFNGFFMIPHKNKVLKVVVSDQLDWDHVSVSVFNEQRCPTWEEMCYIKDLFFDPEETAFQLHPAKKDYINYHPYVLHIWRYQKSEILLPPKMMVGPC